MKYNSVVAEAAAMWKKTGSHKPLFAELNMLREWKQKHIADASLNAELNALRNGKSEHMVNKAVNRASAKAASQANQRILAKASNHELLAAELRKIAGDLPMAGTVVIHS